MPKGWPLEKPSTVAFRGRQSQTPAALKNSQHSMKFFHYGDHVAKHKVPMLPQCPGPGLLPEHGRWLP